MAVDLSELASDVNTLWVLVASALVFFMQAGFAMVEAGLTRAKNAGNIIMKNVMDFCIGTPAYWIIGFGLMFGAGTGFIGAVDFFSLGNYAAILPDGVNFYAYFIFQTVFCATSATIVSGAMAERTKFSAYCIYSAVISLFIYPIEGHWIWGGGWLAQLGFHDFAGSTAVHMVGGVCALIGAKILGPRIGKYGSDGKPKAILGHSLTLAALGVFILWFCWFGFNGGSTVAMTDGAAFLASKVFVNTNLAAAVATVTVMLITWVRYKKPDVSMTLNGALAGLVAITAGCDVVAPWGAACIGLISGFAVVFGIEFIDKVMKIDDPVGAVGVHCLNGALGTILTALFATNESLAGMGVTRGYFLGIQLLGVVSVAAWAGVCITILFIILKHTIGLRVKPEEEIMGLDMHEHGLASAYAGFVTSVDEGVTKRAIEAAVPKQISWLEMIRRRAGKGRIPETSEEPVEEPVVAADEAVPVTLKSAPAGSDAKISKVEIICKQERFESLKEAMMKIGITGMTVSNVIGCGVQKGKPEYYRGVMREVNLLPKVQVDIVVCKVPVSEVVETAKKTLYTGHIGDGKIFVYNVDNAIKVRTGEEGCDALQDVE
jgi:Amt family ammonium transporter